MEMTGRMTARRTFLPQATLARKKMEMTGRTTARTAVLPHKKEPSSTLTTLTTSYPPEIFRNRLTLERGGR